MTKAVAEYYWSLLPSGAQSVLDLGCGSGDIGRFAPANTAVFGVDLDADQIAIANRFSCARQWDLDSEQPLPIEAERFDAVIAKDVLEHLQRPWRLVKEIRRVLKPGGTLVASVICEFGRRTWSDYTHVRGFTAATAGQLIADGGFDVEGVWRMGGVPFSSRFRFLHVNRVLLRFPPAHWLWTSSYEVRAVKPVSSVRPARASHAR
jgi:SAM-dependent methyltransferase